MEAKVEDIAEIYRQLNLKPIIIKVLGSIYIRDATIQDLDKIYEIESKCFEKEHYSKNVLLYLLMNGSSIGLVAEVKGKIVGFIIGIIEHNFLGRNKVGHIYTIDVLPEYRRRGVASKLLEEFERRLKFKRVKECYLEVSVENRIARKLYKKFGYVEIKRLKNYYANHVDGLLMEKVII